MSSADVQSGSQESNKATDAGVEYHSHMTNDGAPGSHSALFGLSAEDGEASSKSEGTQPGDAIAEKDKISGGSSTSSGPTPAEPETKTGTMADGSSTNTPPGAGSTLATPSQGSGEVGTKD